MSFKESIQIDKIESIVAEIYEHVNGIVEYGHCSIHSDEHIKLQLRSKNLLDKLKDCERELDQFGKEMQDWYSY